VHVHEISGEDKQEKKGRVLAMNIGFNEANSKGCSGHTLMKDLEYCEKYGFDFIDIQSECLDRDLDKGIVTLEQIGEFFKNHHLKMLSYNALVHFNMKETQEEKDAVMAELDEIIRRCGILGCSTIVVVPNEDIRKEATRGEIRKDAVEVLKQMVKKVEPHGIRLSLEFCGKPGMTINRFEDAYTIVGEVGSPLVGLTLDEYHFHAMASDWAALEQADGKKIFIWHLNGMEDVPCGAAYNTDAKRLWPGDPKDCLDHKRYADTFKKIRFEGGCCTIEIFRPEYWEMNQEENVRKSAEVTKAHVAKYWN
jgi:2-keto-myo-inositol isomerase